MRVAVVYLAVSCFVVLGLLDVLDGSYRTGIASVCIAAVNALLLL